MKAKINLEKFSAGLADERRKFAEAARPSAQAGAQVIYDLAKAKVPVSSKGHWFHGTSFKFNGKKYFFEAGSLRKSLYQVYSLDKSTDSKATYHISWNRTKAPYAWMVEFGTSRASAHPFMGPAIHEGRAAAVKAIKERFIEEVKK